MPAFLPIPTMAASGAAPVAGEGEAGDHQGASVVTRYRVLAALVAVVIAVGTTAGASGADTGGDELAMAHELNHVRARAGIGPLAIKGELFDLARASSRRQAAAGAVSHNPELALELPANWIRMAENVAAGPDSWTMFNAWLASPAHHQHMLDPRFESVGVGVVDAGNGTYYATMVFMRTG